MKSSTHHDGPVLVSHCQQLSIVGVLEGVDMAQGRIKWYLLDGFYLSKLLRPILPWIEKEQNLFRKEVINSLLT